MADLLGDQFVRSSVDQLSAANISLTNLHANIHRGKAFKLTQFNLALANNGYIYFEIMTPLNNNIHLNDIRIWADDGPITIELIEDPNLTTGITPIVPVNKNRILSPSWTIPSEAVVKVDPTGIQGGLQLDKVVGILQLDDEWVLRAGNLLYLISIQNISGGPVIITARIQWYE